MNTTFDRAAIKERAKDTLRAYRGPCIAAMVVYAVVTMVLTFATAGILQTIVGNVMTVAIGGYFLAAWRGGQPTISDMFASAFDGNFLRKIGGMLWMMLMIFLWSMLFVIPGVVKALSYSLTPYILHDCPNVKAQDALKLSMRMTRGHKGDLFVAGLSFIGWGILSAFTFGILALVFTGPYVQLTFAGIYDELKLIALEEGVVSQAELDGEADVA